MKSKKEKLSVSQLQALADQYGGLPDDENKKAILAPVLQTVPRRQRQVFFQVLDSRRSVQDRSIFKK